MVHQLANENWEYLKLLEIDLWGEFFAIHLFPLLVSPKG